MSEDEYEMEDEYDFSDASHNPYFTDEKNGISSWDYRLIRGEDGLLTVGEVYYNSDGKPVGWILEAAIPEYPLSAILKIFYRTRAYMSIIF